MEDEIIYRQGNRFLINLPYGARRRTMMVGTLQDDCFVLDRDPKKHLYRKGGSYGVSKKLLLNNSFKTIRFNLSTGENLLTTRSYLLAKGFIVHENDFEEQIHLRVKDFGLEKAIAWEGEQQCRNRIKSPNVWEAMGIERPYK